MGVYIYTSQLNYSFIYASFHIIELLVSFATHSKKNQYNTSSLPSHPHAHTHMPPNTPNTNNKK